MIRSVMTIDRSRESDWVENLCALLSYPRSGSHWHRRMLAEITKIRSGFGSAAFGPDLQKVAGFRPPAVNESGDWRTPFFVATHDPGQYAPDQVRIYLRREFHSVLASTRKAEQELPYCWWGGTDAEVYDKWSAHVEEGSAIAELVIDYEDTKADPAATVRAIAELTGLDLTDAEVARAVDAGSLENMLREQKLYSKSAFQVVNEAGATAALNLSPIT